MAQSDAPSRVALAAANYCAAPELFDPSFKMILSTAIQKVSEKYRAQLRKPANEMGRDVKMFPGIIKWAKEGFPIAKGRVVGDTFRVTLSQVRACRPPGITDTPVLSIYPRMRFEELAFHFNMEHVQEERIWEGKLNGRLASCFSTFAFDRLHTLLVPNRDEQHLQLLSKEIHSWVREVADLVGTKIPGFMIAYNSLGAYASVPQLHLQTIVRPAGLPIMDAQWKHNNDDGGRPYPLACNKYVNGCDAWKWISERHRADRPYNLVYAPTGIYCFPRKFQGSYQRADWTGGFAWYECAGNMITFRDRDYDALTLEMILDEYAKMSDDL